MGHHLRFFRFRNQAYKGSVEGGIKFVGGEKFSNRIIDRIFDSLPAFLKEDGVKSIGAWGLKRFQSLKGLFDFQHGRNCREARVVVGLKDGEG